jgi:hypothetical protein
MESIVEPIGGNPFRRGILMQTATLDYRTGDVVPTVVRAQPVVGSVQRVGPSHTLLQRQPYVGTPCSPPA